MSIVKSSLQTGWETGVKLDHMVEKQLLIWCNYFKKRKDKKQRPFMVAVPWRSCAGNISWAESRRASPQGHLPVRDVAARLLSDVKIDK